MEHVACMGRGEAYNGFRWGILSEREHLGDPVKDGRVILRRILRQEVEFRLTDWIGVAQDRESRRSLVNAFMNIRVPYCAKNFLTS